MACGGERLVPCRRALRDHLARIADRAVPAGAYAWLAASSPVARVGYSIYLYELPERRRARAALAARSARSPSCLRLPSSPSSDPRLPTPAPLVVDEQAYDERARPIAAGTSCSATSLYQDPLYSYFLGGLLRLVGDDVVALRRVQAMLGALAVAMWPRLGIAAADSWPAR